MIQREWGNDYLKLKREGGINQILIIREWGNEGITLYWGNGTMGDLELRFN